MKQEGYITPSLHIPKHDLFSLAPLKGEMKSSFSWTSSTLCFGEPTHGKLNEVKLLCSFSSRTLWDPTLAKPNQESELCITKHILLCDSPGHTGIPFPIPRSSSETNRVSNRHSSLVTTPSSRMILGKPKIEVTKVLTHNSGKNGEYFILTDDTNTIIIRSAVRSATKTSPNLRLDPPQGEDQPQDLTSDVFVYGMPNPDGSDHTPPMSILNFDDLLGRTFLLPMDENGERKRATISEHVKDLYQDQVSREDQLRFKLKIDGDQLDELISYNQLMEYLENKTD